MWIRTEEELFCVGSFARFSIASRPLLDTDEPGLCLMVTNGTQEFCLATAENGKAGNARLLVILGHIDNASRDGGGHLDLRKVL